MCAQKLTKWPAHGTETKKVKKNQKQNPISSEETLWTLFVVYIRICVFIVVENKLLAVRSTCQSSTSKSLIRLNKTNAHHPCNICEAERSFSSHRGD